MYTFKENTKNEDRAAYQDKYPSTPAYKNYKLTFSPNWVPGNMVDYCKDSLSILHPNSNELKAIIDYLSNEIYIAFEHYNGKAKIEDKIRFLHNTIKLLVDHKESTLSKAEKFIKKSDDNFFNAGTTIEDGIAYSLDSIFLLSTQDKLSIRLHRYLQYINKELIVKSSSKNVENFRLSAIIYNLSIYFKSMDAESHKRFHDADIIAILMNYLCEETKTYARGNAAMAIQNLLLANPIHEEKFFKPEILQQIFLLLRSQIKEINEKTFCSKFLEQVLYLVSVISIDFYKYSEQNQGSILEILLAVFQEKLDRDNKTKQIYAMNACAIITQAANNENKKIQMPFYEEIIKFLVKWARYSRCENFKASAANLLLEILKLKQSINTVTIMKSGLIQLIATNINIKPYDEAKKLLEELYPDFSRNMFIIDSTAKPVTRDYDNKKIEVRVPEHVNKKMKMSNTISNNNMK